MFLGMFSELWKVTELHHVYSSVHMEQLISLWTDFHEILYLIIFKKSVENQV